MNLELQVVDNFLPEELFKKLADYSITLDYSSKAIVRSAKDYDTHIFLSNRIQEDDNLIKELEKSIKKHFGIKIKNFHLAAFTCVNTKEPTPHTDGLEFPNEKHLIIYLHGDSTLNAGTGFYKFLGKNSGSELKGNFDLNTAVGFYPNRALIFNAAGCYHSPLLYSAEGNLPRFSIIIWFEPENIV
jgi:hypothetical protein